ncbi:TIGR02281 family clan AA aspartic protease [Aliidiomarina halalkaliphila]|uniref:TIGR02281 family clan AA aspartic protease n=2 Tax=Aliidiomarina halalkaliphila TaxID=2593535 RepID=A0A552X6E1_9GAMM|nr:TIGR02281 family clan AA aspartic protease [Aliidiomarina halalkaliphila]
MLGRGFAILAWVSVFAVFYLFFNHYLERQNNPNQEVASWTEGNTAVVELQQNRAGHYLLNGTINGRDVSFLLDTGATQVAIPGRLADELGVSRGNRVQVRTASGIATAYQTRIDDLTFGDIRLRNVSATIVPDYDSSHILLGMSALRALEFTQRDGVLTIRQ